MMFLLAVESCDGDVGTCSVARLADNNRRNRKVVTRGGLDSEILNLYK